MNIRIFTLLALLMLTLAGCGDETPSAKSEADETWKNLPDEITPINELPSVFQQGLSPEEKADLLKKIMPMADDGLSPEERFLKLRQDAEAGDAEAQNALGSLFYSGEAISKDVTGKIMDYDLESAAGWFHRAAEQGHAAAQFNLGLLYAEGQGVPQDSAKAVEWFTKAAEQGNVDAQNNLGVMYLVGEGVPKNIDKAIEWFEKAEKQGNEEARENLKAIRAAGN
ncbi:MULTISPECIES: tetratricopeptide repeat protein [Nitrosomonas]|uniref:Sel1 repeat-containing protein n=1 Tax=Nitrosomonas communis TaxID=44574 RepID=A0A0F7K911_9PROT|nr:MULTISPECIES: tetratricopeptide repeat protein [Nitrosomonas]AKH36695.1 hypothetical protein AAW31_00885 [Nitrosomonas communis]TYP82843.1 hypothetical protein BCL69_10444 [Nitrosomonas communis]UVS61745.1 sel1 repeat family protein [Nitrosomonas sp. PLL12]